MYQSAMQQLHHSLLRNVYLFCVSCSGRLSLARVALQLRDKAQFSIIYLLLYLWPLPQKRLVKVVPTHFQIVGLQIQHHQVSGVPNR